jgi:hypothetical protein
MEDTNSFLTLVRDPLILAFLKFLKGHEIDQPISEIAPPKDTSHETFTLRYFSNIAQNLPKFNLTINGSSFKSLGEITPGIYEGGFKLWECEKDAIHYLQSTNHSLTSFIQAHNPSFTNPHPDI